MNARVVRTVISTTFAVVSALGSQTSHAHHGWGDYDNKQLLTLKAKVVELTYANPHASVVIDAGGKRWNAILAPISRMESRGANRQALEVNQEITVVGYPSRTNSAEMRVERVILGDKTVELR